MAVTGVIWIKNFDSRLLYWKIKGKLLGEIVINGGFQIDSGKIVYSANEKTTERASVNQRAAQLGPLKKYPFEIPSKPISYFHHLKIPVQAFKVVGMRRNGTLLKPTYVLMQFYLTRNQTPN